MIPKAIKMEPEDIQELQNFKMEPKGTPSQPKRLPMCCQVATQGPEAWGEPLKIRRAVLAQLLGVLGYRLPPPPVKSLVQIL